MSDDAVDRPTDVRLGEALDPAALLAYLHASGVALGDEVRVSQFPRGFSNLTYLLECGAVSCILRRPPFGIGKGVAHDVVREARLLDALGGAYARVPRILAICDDPSVIGAPFYLMERARGIILRDRLPDGVAIDVALMRRISEGAVDTLAEIHAIDYGAAGLSSLGHPEGYVERQVSGWTKRLHAASTGPQPEVERIADWLASSRPRERGATLVHNDFKYDNLVLSPADPSRIIAVLDWEMATIGDPWMDLGTMLAYWVERDDPASLQSLGLGITARPGNLTRTEILARYEQASGRAVEQAIFYYVFGLFKVAVIAQQIYFRFVKGFTRDPRFAQLDRAVAALGAAAVRAVDENRIGA